MFPPTVIDTITGLEHISVIEKAPTLLPGTDKKDYYYSRAAGEGIEPSLRWLGSLQKEGALSQTLAPETKGCVFRFHHPAVCYKL